MTIKIEMKPIVYDVEIPGYGIFQISPMGAGAEAELHVLSRELDEAMENTRQYDALVEREKNGEELDHNTDEYKACMKSYQEAGKIVDKLRETYNEKLHKVIKGKGVAKLFEDFTYDQIAEIYKKATKNV